MCQFTSLLTEHFDFHLNGEEWNNLQHSSLLFSIYDVENKTENRNLCLGFEYFEGICGFPRHTGLQNFPGYNACEKLALP